MNADDTPGLLSAEQFAERHGGDPAELVAGVVRPIPRTDARHGWLCANLIRHVGRHVDANDRGHVLSNDSFVQTRRNPDTVRGADLCFFSYERLPRGEVPNGLLPVVPELVIEVRASSEKWTELVTKILEYLAAGVRVVVVIDDSSRSAAIYRSDELPQMLFQEQEFTIPDTLPGFAVAVEKLFTL